MFLIKIKSDVIYVPFILKVNMISLLFYNMKIKNYRIVKILKKYKFQQLMTKQEIMLKQWS